MQERKPLSAGFSADRDATPAATVLAVRDVEGALEVLMVQRNSRGPFGGMLVYPGGQVDEADRQAVTAAQAESHTPNVAAARHAAVREAREEAGIALDAEGLTVLSFWLPPPEAPRRFATWFFLAEVDPDAQVRVDGAEIHDFAWITPRGAMQARSSSKMAMAPPTYMTLWWLSAHRDTASAVAAARNEGVQRFETKMVPGVAGGPPATVWEGDAAFGDGDLERAGPRRRLIMSEPEWSVEVTPT